MKEAEILSKFRGFTEKSLVWCTKEAEQGTARVTGAIDVLLKDIDRVSAMSSESLNSLESLQKMLHAFDLKNYQQIHKSLKTLGSQNAEIDAFIQPIIEALQFQDRFRQNLENVVKMIDVWLGQRAALQDGQALTQTQMQEFAKALMAVTTMKRERDVIREHIDGLPEEAEATRVEFF